VLRDEEKAEQMLPIEQGEKEETLLTETGDMMKLLLLSQVVVVKGQQPPAREHPSTQS
jgi:hypothetical protein